MNDSRLLIWDTISRLWKKVGDGFPMPISRSDGPGVDAFQRDRTSTPFGIFESKFLSTRKRPQWEERLTGAIIVHGAVTGAGFSIGEVITGGTSGMTGTITAKTASSVTFTTSNNDWTDGETITGGTSASTAVITTHNTGSDIVYNYNGSSVLLNVGTVSGQRVIRQSVRYIPYVPGYSHHINTTGTMALGKVNQKQSILYGDDLNAIGFVMNGTEMSCLLRTNTSGSAVDTLVAQTDWNIDKLNGTGISGKTLNPTKSQINDVDFQWLGIGRVRISLNIDGSIHQVHEFNHANETTGVYMRTPTLPIRYEIENIGTVSSSSTLEQICCAVSSEGGYTLPGDEYAASHTWAQEAAVTTRRPIFAIRLKAEFPAGKPNRKQVRLLDFACFVRTNDALFELMHVHNPLTVSAGGVPQALSVAWTSIDDDSCVEYLPNISAITAEHMHFVQSIFVPAATGNGGNTIEQSVASINAHSFISQNFESDNSQCFVIFATSRTGTSNCIAHCSEIESE